ncbi:MAG TPA: ABC transporter permease subunit, partial [Opitutales bacterium]|nr:ABC transporter permease subunit [Opitutales bacterium]
MMKFLSRLFGFAGLCVLLALACQASTQSTQQQPVLRWGADAQSGVPHVFYTTVQPQRLVGFEVEIIEAVAKELGMKSEFVQNEWPSLIPGLQRHLYDVAINGLVPPTSGTVSGVYFSDPYLITYMQLTVKNDTEDIQVLADCRDKKVGVLIATPAVGLLEEVGNVEIRLYDTELNAFNDLAFGRLDAVLMDFPLSLYYGGANPLLKLVGPEIDHTPYAIGISTGCGPEFLTKINEALRALERSGELRRILDRWNLWNAYMADLLHDYRVSTEDPSAFEAYDDFVREQEAAGPTFKDRLRRYWGFMPILLKGAWMTVQVSVISMMLAVLLGLIIALMRVYGAAPVRFLASSYVEIIRGTPLLIQLLLIFYGLP